MIYVPLQFLKPGMVLARDVASEGTFFSLLTIGEILNENSINKLATHDVPGAYIDSEFCDDVQVEAAISPQLKKETITQLKNIFDEYTRKSVITTAAYRAVRKTAENLLLYALSKSDCLLNVIEIKDYDNYTYTHSMYVGILSALIAIQLNLPKAKQLDLCTCGLLHDTGKLDISLDIINKQGKLTDEEFAIIKSHPDKAVERLKTSRSFSFEILSGIRTHHERYDGTGYPLGLKGNEIPLYGRILAVADVYDALTSKRSYRKAWTSSEAIEYMMGGAQTHFDYDVLQAFLRTVAAYPLGAIVKLSSGDMAVVIKNYPYNILRPRVRVFSGESELGQEIDLAHDFKYLNITIEGVLEEGDDMPSILYDTK
ncbi:MAG: HD-GYP domain-containing protein [Oscillospiraceae bacterium]